MPVPALAQAGASLKNPGGMAVLRTCAAALVTALACVACDRTPEAPPPPSAPGQVPEGATLDLKPQITDKVISTDEGGARMTVESKPPSVLLAMPRAGTSRAQLTAVLDPGDYDVHVQVGAVDVQDHGPQGFGAFFGPENEPNTSIELKPDSDQHLRVSVPAKKQQYFALGFGGWGKARGSMEIKALDITRAPKS
jgi:hypothetical protein